MEELLDPVNYISLPQLAFDSMLKLTKVELDLFTPDKVHMHTLFDNACRGGFTTSTMRYVKANHKYLKNYDRTKPSVFIMPFDINGMYSSVQLTPLPVSDYTWMTTEMNDWESYFNKEGEGCFLVVDLNYPIRTTQWA